MSKTLQQEIAHGITLKFKDAVIKKIDKDNYLDIHIPSVNSKYGTHIGFNTSKNKIKIVFYCRDKEFIETALANSKNLEAYAQGIRPLENPVFDQVDKAVEVAIDFLLEINRATQVLNQEPVQAPGLKMASPKSEEAKSVTTSEVEKEDIQEEETTAENNPQLKAMLDALLAGKVSVQVTTDPLVSEVSSSNPSISKIKKLLKEGADVNARNKDSDAYAAVHYAAWDGKDHALKVLLDAGADADLVGGDGATPLHLASSLGRLKAVELLMEAGVDIEKRRTCAEAIMSAEGDTALRSAFVQQHWPVVDYLMANGADISILAEPCSEAINGTTDLFEVVNAEGKGLNRCLGQYDEKKTNELQKKILGEVEINSTETSEFLHAEEDEKYNVYLDTNTPNKLALVKYISEFMEMTLEQSKDVVDQYEWILLSKEQDHETAQKIKEVAESNTGCNVVIKSLTELRQEEVENGAEHETEEDKIEENETEDGEETNQEEIQINHEAEQSDENENYYVYPTNQINYDFAAGKKYKSYFDKFLAIHEKTGILNFEITQEPDQHEREALWDIARSFCERIYQVDNDFNADQHEINVLAHFTVVALHWCELIIHDLGPSYTNGRFRRDTLALALCIFSRISRDYEKYDYLRFRWVMPHTRFSYLMWSLRSIIDSNEDNIFYKFSVEEAQLALDMFMQIDGENQKKGQTGYVKIDDLADLNPLKKIGMELTRILNSNRIPYQFILNYIWVKPNESFFKKLFGLSQNNSSPVRVRLLETDLERNKEFLTAQIKHKQFPEDWSFTNDLAFVYSYFAQTTDGVLSENEKQTIIEKLSEWLDEESLNEKSKTNQQFNLGFNEFEKDPHDDRFFCALENIRRHFHIQFDGDAQQIHTQLRNVMSDLYEIAVSGEENGEYSISSEEKRLLDEMDEIWGTADENYTDNSGEVVDEVENDDVVTEDETDEEDTGFPALTVFSSSDPVLEKRRIDYLMKWQKPSSVYNRRAGISAKIPDWISDLDNDGCCPQFSESQLDNIAAIIERNKLIPILEYAPAPFFNEVKKVWWIVPFSIYREDHASWLFVDKNGIYAAFEDDNDIRGIISWENVEDIDFEEKYEGDEHVNMLTVQLNNGGYITFAEFTDEKQGSYLKVLSKIYEVRKQTIEVSKGKSSWKEGAGGEGFKLFINPLDLLNEKVWLDNPDRPDPRFFS